MKRTVSFGIVALVLVAGFVMLNSFQGQDQSEFFRDALIRTGVERIGQPIEGFSAFLYLEAFPGLTEEDFARVESFEGRYVFEKGRLVYRRTTTNPITSAEETISDQGYKTLLANLSRRFGLRIKSQSDVELLLEKVSSTNSSLESYISESFSLEHPSGWYPHNSDQTVLFTQSEALMLPDDPETKQLNLGPFFQVSVYNVTDYTAWLLENGFTKANDSLVERTSIQISDRKMERIITEVGESHILHYIYFDQPNRVFALSQYPYLPGSVDTSEFEKIITTFVPNTVDPEPDDVDDPDTTLPPDSGVTGTVLLGPTCPVMRDPPDPKCADQPYMTTVQVLEKDSAKSSVFTSVKSDQEGKYRIMLPPGEYTVQPVGRTPLPYCEARDVTIIANTLTTLDLSCDTGIR